MPRCPSWLVAASLLICGPGPQARLEAQEPLVETPAEQRLRELKQRLLDEGGTRGMAAAMELFLTGRIAQEVSLGPEGSQDAFLRDVMLRREVYKASARQSIVEALRASGRYRIEAACRIVQEALDDPQQPIATLAVSTFSTFEDERGTAYRFIENRLIELRRARPGMREHKLALGLVEALERMPNPIEAVGVLITVLDTSRLSRGLETRVREASQRMTAQTFETARAWREWYEGTPSSPGARSRSLAEWRLEVARRRDDRLRRYESEAERYFGRLLAALQTDKEALFRELQGALNDSETVLAVRRAAIRELSALGARGEERALSLLRARLSQPSVGAGPGEYDEVKAIILDHLGQTGNTALLEDIVPYLRPSYHLRMRTAAANAIGALRAPAGVDPLLALLAEVGTPSGPPDELVEVVVAALGAIGANPDDRVSGAFLDLARALRGAVNGSAASATSMLPIVVENLGKLPYAAMGREADRVTKLLQELVAHEDANIRFYAASALGTVPHASAFPALTERLPLETAVQVRKSLLDSIGQQALDNPELVGSAMKLLAPFLEHVEEQLRRKARECLAELATEPQTFKQTFVGLELLVQALRETYDGSATGAPVTPARQNVGKAPSLAAPFLVGERGLPPPDALTPAQAPNRARYYQLLEVRAFGLLDTNPEAALADFTAVIQGRDMSNPTGPEARALHAGKARALLRLSPPSPARAREALQVVTACFPPGPGEDAAELWSIALDAAERLKETDAAAAAAALQPLQQHVAAAAPDVQRRFAALAGPGR